MKKLLALVLAAVMALAMTACGGNEEEPKSTIDKILEQGYISVAISPVHLLKRLTLEAEHRGK